MNLERQKRDDAHALKSLGPRKTSYWSYPEMKQILGLMFDPFLVHPEGMHWSTKRMRPQKSTRSNEGRGTDFTCCSCRQSSGWRPVHQDFPKGRCDSLP